MDKKEVIGIIERIFQKFTGKEMSRWKIENLLDFFIYNPKALQAQKVLKIIKVDNYTSKIVVKNYLTTDEYEICGTEDELTAFLNFLDYQKVEKREQYRMEVILKSSRLGTFTLTPSIENLKNCCDKMQDSDTLTCCIGDDKLALDGVGLRKGIVDVFFLSNGQVITDLNIKTWDELVKQVANILNVKPKKLLSKISQKGEL